jgi:hypothetical protein
MRGRSLFMVLLTSAALTAQSAPTWPIRSAPPELRPLVARADLMIVEMHNSVLRELTDALSEGDAAQAMGSCHIDSRLITLLLARGGVGAGRTSHRLRNPANQPPRWAEAIVETYAGRRSRDVDGFVIDLGYTMGVLRPISQQPVCANCHAPLDHLSEPVRLAIATRYPHDQAVGFREGEVRGWFWVELPKVSRDDSNHRR